MKRELPYFSIDGYFGGSQSWFLDPWMHIGGCGALTMCDLVLYQTICRGREDFDPFRRPEEWEAAADRRTAGAGTASGQDMGAAGSQPEPGAGESTDAASEADREMGARPGRDPSEGAVIRQSFVPSLKRPMTKRDYKKLGMIMKPYLRPRESGIKDLKTFIDGARIYLEDSDIRGFSMEALEGHAPYAKAEEAVRDRIDQGMPLPMLMLKHQDKRFNFFEWHWFLIVGYDDGGERGDIDGDGSLPVTHEGDSVKPLQACPFRIRVATYGKEHWLDFEEFWDTGEEERGGLVLIHEERG